MFNKLLERQIQKYLGGECPDHLQAFLKVVNESYEHYEKDRKMIERSIDLSSTEMIELNDRLRRESDELQSAHNEFKNLFENIDEVFFSIDLQHFRVIHMSPACKRVYGYTPEEFSANLNLWKDVIHPDDKHMVASHDAQLAAGKTIVNQYRIIHKSGDIRWLRAKAIPIFNAAQVLVRIDGITTDITDEKMAEEKIVQAEHLLSEAQYLAMIGNWNYDALTGEVFWSEGLRNMFGVSQEYDVVFDTFVTILHPGDKDRVMAEIYDTFKSGRSLKHSYRIIRQNNDEVRVVQGVTYVTLDETGGLVRSYGIVQDVTELTGAREKLERTLADLEQRVEERTKDLVIKTQKITDSISYAKRIQTALLPNADILRSYFQQSFVFSRPLDMVGGDLYWVHRHKNNILLACVDCTGHGVPGAFVSIIAIDLLNKIVKDQAWSEPAMVLKLIDEGIHQSIGSAKTEGVRDGMDMTFCNIDLNQKRIGFAGATSSIVVVNQGGIHTVKGNRNGLGGDMELSKKKFITRFIDYNDGDLLYLFTDGFRDQMGGALNKKFKHSRLLDLLQRVRHIPAAQQHQIFIDEFEVWQGDNEQTDDVLILGMELFSNVPGYKIQNCLIDMPQRQQAPGRSQQSSTAD
jgi:PAS domain S-box-containing protein